MPLGLPLYTHLSPPAHNPYSDIVLLHKPQFTLHSHGGWVWKEYLPLPSPELCHGELYITVK